MKKVIIFFSLIVLSLRIANVNATVWEGATIIAVEANTTGDVLFTIQHSSPSSSCSNPAKLSVPASSGSVDRIYSLILSAKVTQSKVVVYGAGECYGQYEKVHTINMYE